MGWHISCTGAKRKAYGYQRDGGHSDYIIADIQNLVKMPSFLTFVDGAMVACGVGTAYAACLRAQVSGRDRVLITGLGPVGMCIALIARASGAEVYGVELVPERRLQAAAHNIPLIESDAAEAMKVTGGKGFEVCFDASGNSQARHFCLEAARRWGRVVYVGEGGNVTFSPSPMLLHKQITLHGK
jgi:threonine dehydrogenase-like Zn-dependent dehydrogenase